MYHAHLKGTHYEAGYRWGSLLLKNQHIILEKVPFAITEERLAYAQSCLPIYQKDYPEILEEIQGIADGQQCDVRHLQAVLFGMYVLPPSCCCSCFAFSSEQQVMLGRNSDFLTALEGQNLNVVYRLNEGAYAFTGNTSAFVEMEDGINQHGLAVGLTAVYPRQPKPGWNAGLLLRYLLERCKTVKEAIHTLHSLPIASSQTFTMADCTGEIALVECNAEQVAVRQSLQQPFVCATNRFYLEEMQQYNLPQVDDWFAQTRYQTLYTALKQKGNGVDLLFAKELLSGNCGFLCQYDRSTGKDTVWSVVYDLKQRKIYHCEGNPGRRSFREDKRFRF